MAELEIPFPLKGLPLKPELKGRQKVDDVLIQTLSTLLGHDGEGRRLLKCTLGGSLHTTTPPTCCIVNKVTTGTGEHITFGSIQTTEIMVKAKSTNTGSVWVNVSTPAGDNIGWPLGAGEFLNISINDMSNLRLWVEILGDRVIILRTV